MVKTKVLNSGTRLAVDEMKGFEGVAFKIFVFTGSANESEEKDYGISHLIEHRMFKGTDKRNALQIVQEFDKFGIQSNAYTSEEVTCYYTYGTKDSLEKSVEILSDMFFNSKFDNDELKREKQVVIEEIDMYQDRPDIVCETEINRTLYDGTNFSHDIAGTAETVAKITREQIFDYINKRYTPKNIILSVAGNVKMEEIEQLVEKYFEPNFKIKEKYVPNHKDELHIVTKTQSKVKKDTSQAQVCIAYKSNNKYKIKENTLNSIISYILGGGMSSRLFQEVREKLSLVYNISAYNDTNAYSGKILISLGTNPKKVPLALKTIKKVIDESVKNRFNEEELDQAKIMDISNIKLQSDSPNNQASINASQLQVYNKTISKEQRIARILDIKLDDVNAQLKNLFDNKNYCISMVADNTDLDLIGLYEGKALKKNKENVK